MNFFSTLPSIVDCKSKRTIFYPQRAFTITNVRLLCQFTLFPSPEKIRDTNLTISGRRGTFCLRIKRKPCSHTIVFRLDFIQIR
jgi:hypothetical protein